MAEAAHYGAVSAPLPAQARSSMKMRGAGITLLLAGLALCCVAGGFWMMSDATGNTVLLGTGLGGLEDDVHGLQNIGSEVDEDMAMNTQLSKQYKNAFEHKDDKCHCDCSKQPQLAQKAAASLEQVGENVFFGPCAGCPCMQANNLEDEVRSLLHKLQVAEEHEDELHKKVDSQIPVDIVMRVGQKGKNGAKGPKGFQGPDGYTGRQGPSGATGPRGPTGPRGETGPKGYKGNDGPRGPPGFQGSQGKPGPPGLEGQEGGTGARGYRGGPGKNGAPGPPGQRGPSGPRGKNAPPFGKRGPPGEQGPRGPKGVKGPDGDRGPKGFVGPPGNDGSRGSPGTQGPRGIYGKGCNGARPTNGKAPKVIDACGVCGGDESECANTRYAKYAHAVGDPHYLTFDGKSFDYQVRGEFLLARHMNDLEMQNLQVVCPNPRVRCNVGAAVITKNWNFVFKSEWMNHKVSVNGVMWKHGRDFHWGRRKKLDSTTWVEIHSWAFFVIFNDLKVGDGAMAYGYFRRWGPPLPNNHYMDLYFKAPGRWSSGLSMTGLFANFDNNRYDDWEAIAPSTLWWLKGTKSSAFTNPKYLLTWDNRIMKTAEQRKAAKGAGHQGVRNKAEGATALVMTDDGKEVEFSNLKWTHQDELRALKEVDPLTAKMRRHLFNKMAREGVIERTPGEKKPTTGLAAAELDIMPYEGERPDHLRIEQQMLFRKEWKFLTPKQKVAMLAGSVTSNNAAGMKHMCEECVRGTQECTDKKIVETPKADGITYKSKDEMDACHKACIPWIEGKPCGQAVCKCRIDCALDVKKDICTRAAVTNYITFRTAAYIPGKGAVDLRCKALTTPQASRYKGSKPGKKDLWKQEYAPNFAISFWWKINKEKTYKDKGNKVLLYKGPEKLASGEKIPVLIEVEADTVSIDGDGKIQGDPILKITVAGVEFRVPKEKCSSYLKNDDYNFYAVTKKDKNIAVWIGTGKEATKTSLGDIGNAEYKTSTEHDLYLVGTKNKDTAAYIDVAADPGKIPFGTMGKLKYMGADKWDPDGKVPLWENQIPKVVEGEKPDCT